MIKRLLKNDWFIALLFLIGYLCTNSYIFAWDDQHLEIPLLKHLIDPALYKGDYYVEGLAKNFSSYLYPILSHLLKNTDQVQPTYLVLFLISRYFMFFWIYRLWQLISGDRFAAAMAVLMFFLMGRTEEFLYRTFSHQEFSYIFMFAGFYYFYKERYFLAAIFLGVGANFHAIYSLFPMLYMITFLIITRKDRFAIVLKSGITFCLCALPFLLWQIPRSMVREGAAPVPILEWLPLYLISCQQNFLFWTVPLKEALSNPAFVLGRLEPYLYLLALYIILLVIEPRLRKDLKTHVLVGVGYFFILITFYFSYIHPSRLFLDLNLIRNEQFIRFMLMGYATIFAVRVTREGKLWQTLAAGVFLFLVGFNGTGYFVLKLQKFWYVPVLFAIVFIILRYRPDLKWLRTTFVIIPITAAFISFSIYHYNFLQVKWHGGGLWQMHRSWIDMQKFVRAHTDKNAMILTPYDTEYGGFRIYSERKVLVCYRDCGIIGFDYNAAVEWNKRIKEIEQFRMMSNQSIEPSVINAIKKYHVDYIVFMNYYQPGEGIPLFTKMYQNEVLALYKVNY